MKHLYSLVLVLLMLGYSTHVKAQSVVATMISYPGLCDGTANFWDHANFSSGWTWTWYKDTTSISTGATELVNLCPGDYILILDSSGIQLSHSFTIRDPCSYLTYTHVVTPATLGNCDGMISTIPYFGSTPFTYNWSNGSTDQNIMNVCPGTYTVTCTDGLGCSATITTTVDASIISPNLTFEHGPPGDCYGYATVAPTGGSGTYFYEWSTGDSNTSISGLCPGNYSVSIWDSNGSDTVTVGFSIVNPCVIIFAVYDVTKTVNGNCNGSVVTSIYGGIHPFTYSWSGGQTTADLSNVCAGTYTLNCIDSLGCTLQQTVDVTDSVSCNGFTGSFTSTPASGPAICDGSLAFNPSGGTAPYTYIWPTGETTASLTNLCPGTYTVSCVDHVGCIVTDTALVDATYALSATLNTVDDSISNCTGSASILPSGGTPPYSIYWSTGETTTSIDSLCAGIYTASVIDATNTDTLTVDFIIADSSSIYGGNPYPNAPINDTLYMGLVSNCVIDYSDIDSASLYQAVYDPVNQNLFVTWAIYSPTDTVYISDTLGWASGSPGYYYMVTISVYCTNKSGHGFFKIESVIYFDGTNVWFSTLGVNEQLLDHVTIYPNPFTGSISVDNKDGMIRSMKLVDLNGRLLSEMNSVNSGLVEMKQLETISSGTYLLILSGEHTSKTFKVIK
ncbi:hypothetical protein D3C87_64420 [compost metagenome]